MNIFPAAITSTFLLLVSIMATAETPVTTIGISTSTPVSMDGYLQTPAGGNPGTSSYKRPTLDELDIQQESLSRFSSQLQWKQASAYLNYQPLTLSGSAQLKQNLVTHSTTFTAGDMLHSQVSIDQEHIGGGWRWLFDDERLSVTPALEFAIMHFSYHISNGTQATGRSYRKGALRAGINIHYQSTPHTGFLFHGMTSLPTPSAPKLDEITAGIEFNMNPEAKSAQYLLFLGISEQRLNYQDAQKLPNNIRIDTDPFLTMNFSIRF